MAHSLFVFIQHHAFLERQVSLLQELQITSPSPTARDDRGGLVTAGKPQVATGSIKCVPSVRGPRSFQICAHLLHIIVRIMLCFVIYGTHHGKGKFRAGRVTCWCGIIYKELQKCCQGQHLAAKLRFSSDINFNAVSLDVLCSAWESQLMGKKRTQQ